MIQRCGIRVCIVLCEVALCIRLLGSDLALGQPGKDRTHCLAVDNKQLVAGYSKTTAAKGLVAHMADYSRFLVPTSHRPPGRKGRPEM